jgi:hypothetical protein
MTTHLEYSHGIRNKYLEFDPLIEIGRHKRILESLHRKLRQSLSDSEIGVTSFLEPFHQGRIT